MKKVIAFFSVIVLAASVANAQSSLLGSLKNVLGSATSSSESSSTVSNILNSVIGTVISQTTTVSLPGTWTYNGVSSAIETGNTLTNVAASAYKTNLESKANGYLKKIGLKPGVGTLTFAEDGNFTVSTGSKQIAAGTYTYTDGVLKMKFGKVYNYLSMTGTVVATANGCQILFDADKFLRFASTALRYVGSFYASATTISTLVDQVQGLKLGFELTK